VRCFKDEEDLAKFIASVSHDDFPEKFSPWEILILPKCQDDPDCAPAYAIVFRFHHVIADGVSLVRSFISSVVDEDIKTVDRKPAPKNKTGKNKPGNNKVSAAGQSAEVQPAGSEDVGPKISLPGARVGFFGHVRGFFNLASMAAHNFTKPDSNSFFGRQLQGIEPSTNNTHHINIS
jgi:hypothetical protein